MSDATPQARHAALWTVLAILAADVEPLLVKVGYQAAATPLQLLALKTMVAALLIYPLTRRWEWIGWAALRRLAPVSMLLLLTNGLTLAALRYTTVVTMITVVTSTPAMVALVNRARGRESHSLQFWVGFVLCFAGVLGSVNLHGADGGATSHLGVLLLVGAVISSTIYRTAMEDVTSRHPPLLVSTYTFFVNGSLCALLLLPSLGSLPPQALGIGCWIGFAGAIANVAFISALHALGATRLSIFTMLQRPLIIVLAGVFLHEPIAWTQWVGIAAVIAGVQLAKVKRKAA